MLLASGGKFGTTLGYTEVVIVVVTASFTLSASVVFGASLGLSYNCPYLLSLANVPETGLVIILQPDVPVKQPEHVIKATNPLPL